MSNALAFANNDLVIIAWSYDSRPDGCLGFAVYRVDPAGTETALPSHAVWPGEKIADGQTTEHYPIQKFYWKDPYARLEADKTGQRRFHYKIVPLGGTPKRLRPLADFPTLTTNEVTLTATMSPTVKAVFNRGLISTQRVARALAGHPTATNLVAEISKPASALRASLSGDMAGTLLDFLDRAATAGRIYAALYELADEELIAKLRSLGQRLSLVLSNSITKNASGAPTDANAAARALLAASDGEQHDRIFGANQIGHNKFAVYTDTGDQPVAVLLGSTNWTPTGLCTQTNNTLVIDDPTLAARYLDYWHQIASDTDSAHGNPHALQAAPLRTWNATPASLTLADGSANTQSWFSPNTPHLRTTTTHETAPVDMAALITHLNAARHAVLFLAFYPGTPSIANWAADALRDNPHLFVRGCVTNPSAAESFYYELHGGQPPRHTSGAPHGSAPQDPRVIAAQALDKTIPTGWQQELLNAGFAIIHDKIVVIDPFDDNCVVVTGSHNLGYKASHNNDENLVMIQGHHTLATAYTAHVLDVYDHFAWRYRVEHSTQPDDPSLDTNPTDWLARYYNQAGNITNEQLKFWTNAKLRPEVTPIGANGGDAILPRQGH